MPRERWLVISNCQTHGFANSLQALAPDVEVIGMYPHSFNNAPIRNNRNLARFDRLFISPGIEKIMPRARLERIDSHLALPWINFRAYHPDLVYAHCGGTPIKSPADDYHSAIVLAAYKAGLSESDARRLFNARMFEACGMFDWWQPERDRLIAHLEEIGISISTQIRRWGLHEPFMYSINHPRIRVLYDISKELVRMTGREPLSRALMPHDNLAFAGAFAVYPEIAEVLGVEGAYLFKTFDTYRQFDLDEFIIGSFAIYERYPREKLGVIQEFQQVLDVINSRI